MVTIGKIVKPFGVKGEVRVASLTDVPGRFEHLEQVTLALPNGDIVTTEVLSIREAGEHYLVRFSGCAGPEEAGRFRGAFIQIPEESNLPREKDTFYQFELVGLQVENQQGQSLGIVEDILEFPQQQVFVIRQEGKEWLLPARKEMIDAIDLPNRTLRLAANDYWDLSNAL